MSPLDAVQEVPDDFDYALNMAVSLGKSADAWRMKQLNILKSIIGSSRTLDEYWSRRHLQNAKHVAPQVRPHVADILGHSFLWPDTQLPEMLAEGAKPLFAQEATGVFRGKSTEHTISEEEFRLGSGQYMKTLVQRPPPSADQIEVVWKLSEKERGIDTLFGYYSLQEMNEKYGTGQWRASPRHAIWQNGKWRLIDDGKAGEQNATYSSTETIHTTCTSAGVAAAASLRKKLGRPFRGKWKLSVATQDMKRAYRQIPIHPEQERWCVVMLWHPGWGAWAFAEARGLLFGLAGAVLAFNRVPAFIVAVARRWLAIPVNSFFDDFRIFDVAKSGGSANRFFKLLVEDVLGWMLDADKEQPPSQRITFLGVVEDYFPSDDAGNLLEDYVALRPKDGRVEDILESIKASLSKPLAGPTPGN